MLVLLDENVKIKIQKSLINMFGYTKKGTYMYVGKIIGMMIYDPDFLFIF